jgi:hypothetical protein
LVDLFAQNQAGQVQHGADPDTGAQIGRASSEVPNVRVKSVIEFLLQLGIDLINGLPGLLQLQPGAQRLHPQMILLIDHDAERLFAIENQAAAGILGRVFPANQVPLDQDIFVEQREVVHRLGEVISHLGQGLDGRPDTLENADSFGLFGPARKRRALDVAGEPHAAGHDDLIVRPFAA